MEGQLASHFLLLILHLVRVLCRHGSITCHPSLALVRPPAESARNFVSTLLLKIGEQSFRCVCLATCLLLQPSCNSLLHLCHHLHFNLLRRRLRLLHPYGWMNTTHECAAKMPEVCCLICDMCTLFNCTTRYPIITDKLDFALFSSFFLCSIAKRFLAKKQPKDLCMSREYIHCQILRVSARRRRVLEKMTAFHLEQLASFFVTKHVLMTSTAALDSSSSSLTFAY